ncbi:MAG: hypothetical protein EBV54_08655, partial [Burkholderiaceae bacterium]|nr:hypothetical protein [Burkholderiaceae bacterium]
RPGESLFLRIRPEEITTWKKIVDDPGLPFTCSILPDADVQFGHAYVEVAGARIDVGQEARKALVSAALGLAGAPSLTAELPSLPISSNSTEQNTNVDDKPTS